MTGSANFFVKSPNIALVGVEPTLVDSESTVLPIRRKSSESDFVIAIADARSLPLGGAGIKGASLDREQ